MADAMRKQRGGCAVNVACSFPLLDERPDAIVRGSGDEFFVGLTGASILIVGENANQPFYRHHTG
jgi:hypothetical protein